MKINKKYNYVRVSRTTENGSRTYDVKGTKLPSVTTILDKTKDKSFLDRGRARVGDEEAERIKNHSSKRGTSMHKFIEKHITGAGYDDLTTIGQQAKPMAQKIIDVGSGVFLATALQLFVFPFFGMYPTVWERFHIAVMFMCISILRSWVWRIYFRRRREN